MEVYRFGQCLGERFSPISTFFSLVSSRAFRDAPHSRFWFRNLKLCLLDFLKLLHLAISQVCTRVFHSWLSVALNNAWVGDSRPFISFLSLVFARLEMATLAILVSASQTMLTGLFKVATFSPFSNLHTCVSLVVVRRFKQCLGWRFSPICIFSLAYFRAFRDGRTRNFGVGISNYAYWTFLRW